MELENICQWLIIAKEQREHELERGLDLSGTKSYQEKGCYNCNGLNYECKYYLNLYELKEDKQ